MTWQVLGSKSVFWRESINRECYIDLAIADGTVIPGDIVMNSGSSTAARCTEVLRFANVWGVAIEFSQANRDTAPTAGEHIYIAVGMASVRVRMLLGTSTTGRGRILKVSSTAGLATIATSTETKPQWRAVMCDDYTSDASNHLLVKVITGV